MIPYEFNYPKSEPDDQEHMIVCDRFKVSDNELQSWVKYRNEFSYTQGWQDVLINSDSSHVFIIGLQ